MQRLPAAPPRFQILSLDGGGLKSLFTAAYLAEWEAHAGRPVVDSMDLIAGTSAGGIVALGLGAGYCAQDLVSFFTKHGQAIFPAERIEATGYARQALSSRYGPEPLEAVLDEYFGDRRLGDSSVRLIVPAYHAESGIHLFKTSHHPRLRLDWRERMAVVARATSAAPTFLPPLVLDQGLRMVDGAVWANNPVQIAVTEALGYLDQRQDQIAALRVGATTEVLPKGGYPDDPGGVGLNAVALFASVMMRGQSQAASGGVQQLLGTNRFVEVDPVVAPGDYRIDRLSQDLIGMAKATFRKTVSELGDKGFLDHRAGGFSPCHTDNKDVSHG
ncbi:MAG: CBASS cGAMP-activated phospholipase [Gammaproteobacteria bacterium]|nr:CBASS cGAMP-activated phospholipase [Gammaproteobacteria bacterium]